MPKRELTETGADERELRRELEGDRGASDLDRSVDVVEPNILGPADFATEAEYRAHLTQLEADAPAEDDLAPLDYVVNEVVDEAQEERLSVLRDELAILQMRFAVIQNDLTRVGKARMEWANASAHEQLGDYPWLKLAAATLGTFFVTRLLKRLP
jgi:hypothetical protein